MNEITIFKNEQFGEVRTMIQDGEPWFVGKDAAKILGYARTADAIRVHVDEEDKGVGEIQTPGGKQPVTIINESGLYSLILSSKLPTAKEFKHWVTSEVLPTIRRHGGYIAGEEKMSDDQLIAQALIIANRKIEERTAQLSAATAKIAELAPKADYYDAVRGSEGSTSFRETAKFFGIPERRFTRFIEEHRFCYRDAHNRLTPYADRLKAGWFEVAEVTYGSADAQRTTIYTKITPKGRTELFRRMKEKEILT